MNYKLLLLSVHGIHFLLLSGTTSRRSNKWRSRPLDRWAGTVNDVDGDRRMQWTSSPQLPRGWWTVHESNIKVDKRGLPQ